MRVGTEREDFALDRQHEGMELAARNLLHSHTTQVHHAGSHPRGTRITMADLAMLVAGSPGYHRSAALQHSQCMIAAHLHSLERHTL
jgi:hypothetical protein